MSRNLTNVHLYKCTLGSSNTRYEKFAVHTFSHLKSLRLLCGEGDLTADLLGEGDLAVLRGDRDLRLGERDLRLGDGDLLLGGLSRRPRYGGLRDLERQVPIRAQEGSPSFKTGQNYSFS